MPKLIFLNRYFYPDHSATSQLLSDLAFHLAGRGYEVHVITNSRQYRDPANRFPPKSVVEGVQIHRVWTSHLTHFSLLGRALDYFSFYLTAGWKLLTLTRRGDLVIALTDPPLISVISTLVAKLRGARTLNWLQDLFPEIAIQLGIRGFKGLGGRTLQALRNASLRSAECNIVLGKHMATLVGSHTIPPHQIQVIPNWSDGDTLRPIAHSDNALRHTWGLENQFVVGYSGNLGRAHEYQTLLDAAEQLRHHPDIRFLFIGGGFMHEKLQQAVQQRRLENFLFMPYQAREHLNESLGAADVHWISLLPSLEGLIVPSKFYGIIAAGRPVLMVGDPNGEIGDLVQQHQCGYAIPLGDSVALAKKILYLRDHPDTCATLGNNARQLSDQQFTQQRALGLWLEVIERSLAGQVPTKEF